MNQTPSRWTHPENSEMIAQTRELVLDDRLAPDEPAMMGARSRLELHWRRLLPGVGDSGRELRVQVGWTRAELAEIDGALVTVAGYRWRLQIFFCKFFCRFEL